jgi:hypothetical protein
MHDQPGGLVDDEEVLVLPRDPELVVLTCGRLVMCDRSLELDLLPTREAVALRARGAIDYDCARSEQPLRLAARADLGQRGDEAVKPLSGGVCRDACADGQVRRAPPNMIAAKRIATPTTMNVSARLKAGQ